MFNNWELSKFIFNSIFSMVKELFCSFNPYCSWINSFKSILQELIFILLFLQYINLISYFLLYNLLFLFLIQKFLLENFLFFSYSFILFSNKFTFSFFHLNLKLNLYFLSLILYFHDLIQLIFQSINNWIVFTDSDILFNFFHIFFICFIFIF